MSNTDNTITDTGNGFIVGAQPAQPRRAADWTGDNTQTQPKGQTTQSQTDERPAYRWTDEDIANARQQEKDKLYGRIEQLGGQMQEIQAAREAEAAERQRLADEADAARKAKEENEMDLRTLMERREAELRAEMEQIRQAQEMEREVFNRERTLQQVDEYRRDRIAQESEYLMPELRQYIAGDTMEAIDAAIERVKADTANIVSNFVQQAEPPPIPYQPRGAAPTAPPVGPMEQLTEQTPMSLQDLRAMDMDTYKKHRNQLLQATNPNRR